MTAEADYIAALLRCFVAGGEAAPDPPAAVDWHRFTDLVGRHGITPALAALPLPERVPAQIRDGFERARREHRRRSGLMWLELGGVLDSFHAESIDCVLLKGLALGRTIYGAPEQRLVVDFDVLVRHADLERALAALQARGYAPANARRHVDFYRQHHFHLVLSGPGHSTFELHWNLARPADYFRFDIEGFFARSRWLEEGPTRVRIPSDGDQLLHAACQAVRRGYSDLRRIVDAALLVRRGATDDPALALRARSQGMATPLWALLELQRHITGIEAPREFERTIRPKTLVRTCMASLGLVERTLSLEGRDRAGLRSLLNWLSAPDTRAALQEIGRFLAPGAAELLDGGHLPDALPRGGERLILGLRHGWSLVKIIGFQGFCLARYGVGG